MIGEEEFSKKFVNFQVIIKIYKCLPFYGSGGMKGSLFFNGVIQERVVKK